MCRNYLKEEKRYFLKSSMSFCIYTIYAVLVYVGPTLENIMFLWINLARKASSFAENWFYALLPCLGVKFKVRLRVSVRVSVRVDIRVSARVSVCETSASAQALGVGVEVGFRVMVRAWGLRLESGLVLRLIGLGLDLGSGLVIHWRLGSTTLQIRPFSNLGTTVSVKWQSKQKCIFIIRLSNIWWRFPLRKSIGNHFAGPWPQMILGNNL